VPWLAPADLGSSGSWRTLGLRTLSALVLAPIAIAVVWFGSPWLPILTALAGAVMAWEWARLCCGPDLGHSGWALIGAVCVAVFLAATVKASPGLLGAPVAAVIVYAFARVERPSEALRLALGTIWIAFPCVLFLWIAQSGETGRIKLLWIFAVVWTTDIGAYAIGRLFGGPRLAPRWSPGKTWAGLIGGVGCAALAGWGTARASGISAVPLVLASAGLAIVEQFGDLAESVAKRRFGVKDSSGLIPGHGGLLDRLDGLLAVVPAVALLTLIDGGNVLTWR
jgi:phosphatidate cytidylyltransferase